MPKQTTRLMVLGIVAYRQPISGYGIEKTLDEWAVQRWTTIAPASIYQQLRSLRDAALISETRTRTGRAIEYACTESGKQELHRMLLELLDEQDFQPLSLIPMLYFTPTLARDELEQGLSRRITLIELALDHEADVIERSDAIGPSHVTEIFRLTWHGLRADKAWCLDFRDRIRIEHGPPTR